MFWIFYVRKPNNVSRCYFLYLHCNISRILCPPCSGIKSVMSVIMYKPCATPFMESKINSSPPKQIIVICRLESSWCDWHLLISAASQLFGSFIHTSTLDIIYDLQSLFLSSTVPWSAAIVNTYFPLYLLRISKSVPHSFRTSLLPRWST